MIKKILEKKNRKRDNKDIIKKWANLAKKDWKKINRYLKKIAKQI